MISLDALLNEEEDLNLETEHGGERGIPYPQANSLSVVLQVVLTLRDVGMSVYELVATGIVNNSRQARYYYNAAAFLGYCFRRGDFFYPTELADVVKRAPESKRAEVFAGLSLACPKIAELYVGVFRHSCRSERLDWLRTRIASREGTKAMATLERRATCMLGWIAWIQKTLPMVKD